MGAADAGPRAVHPRRLARAARSSGSTAISSRRSPADSVREVAILTPEQERWAEALAIEKRYGAGAPTYVAERVGTLALAGDEAGVQRFKEIAARLDQFMRGEPRQ